MENQQCQGALCHSLGRHRVRGYRVVSPAWGWLEDGVEWCTRNHIGGKPLSRGPDGVISHPQGAHKS